MNENKTVRYPETARLTQFVEPSGLTEDQPRSLSLILYHRDGAKVVALTAGEPLVVGRVSPSDVAVPDPSLSRQHARFELSGDQVTVEDLGSTNGTWIAGKNVTREVIRAGAVVTLGAVTASVEERTGALAPHLGLDGHDRFLATLDAEVVRARHFGRPLSVVMLRDPSTDDSLLHRWTPAIHESLRPVDRMALYGGMAVEVLLPEMGPDKAAEQCEGILQALRSKGRNLLCGIAGFPDSATSADGLIAACREALDAATARRSIHIAPAASSAVWSEGGAGDTDPAQPIAESQAMKDALEMARRLARGVIPVLLHGETGSGKEVLARFIHDHGPRSEKPLVSVNCAAIPSQLVESTLFGHEKGAFTGANQRREGVFESAHGGTVLLDEIGELPPEPQAALLRVLETKTITRVGSTRELPVDVRIMAASHRNLEAMAATGEFREDLYYRLNALTLEIPPLRDRPEDVEPLAHHFLEQANQRNDRAIQTIEADAFAAMRAYPWPGNIRELRNAIERAVVIAQHDTITVHDIPRRVRTAHLEQPAEDGTSEAETPGTTTSPDGAKLRRDGEEFRACLERLESQVLVEALEEAQGNQTEAAKRLKMPRRTLVHKLKVFGIRRADSEEAK